MPDQKQTVIDPWDLLQRLADALAYSASTGSCSVADVKLADEARRAVANRPVPSGADALREAVERLPMFVAACQPVDGWREGQEGPVLHGDCVRRCDVLAEIDRAAPAVASSGAEGEREALAALRAFVEAERLSPDEFGKSSAACANAVVRDVLREIDRLAAAPAPAVTDPEGERIKLWRCPVHGITDELVVYADPERLPECCEPSNHPDLDECGCVCEPVVAIVIPAPSKETSTDA